MCLIIIIIIIIMAQLNSLFARGEEIGDPRDYSVRDVICAQLRDQYPVFNEVESFLKVKENHPHNGPIAFSRTGPSNGWRATANTNGRMAYSPIQPVLKKGIKACLQWKVHLAYPASLQALHSNSWKQIIQIQHNRIKNPKWQEATSWLIISVAKDFNSVRSTTDPASGQSGTRTRDSRTASPTR